MIPNNRPSPPIPLSTHDCATSTISNISSLTFGAEHIYRFYSLSRPDARFYQRSSLHVAHQQTALSIATPLFVRAHRRPGSFHIQHHLSIFLFERD